MSLQIVDEQDVDTIVLYWLSCVHTRVVHRSTKRDVVSTRATLADPQHENERTFTIEIMDNRELLHTLLYKMPLNINNHTLNTSHFISYVFLKQFHPSNSHKKSYINNKKCNPDPNSLNHIQNMQAWSQPETCLPVFWTGYLGRVIPFVDG